MCCAAHVFAQCLVWTASTCYYKTNVRYTHCNYTTYKSYTYIYNVYITYKSYIQHSEGSKVHVAIAYVCCTHTWRAAGEHIRTHSVQLCCTKGVCVGGMGYK